MAYHHGWSQNITSSVNIPGVESSVPLSTGCVNEHHEWLVTQKMTPKPLSQEQLISANVSPGPWGLHPRYCPLPCLCFVNISPSAEIKSGIIIAGPEVITPKI